MLIACLRSAHSQAVRLIVARAAKLALERGPQIAIRNENIANLQASKVKCFRWRCAQHHILRELLAQARKRHVREPRTREVGMNLVGDNRHAMRQANLAYAAQLVGAPLAPHWVVWTAQYEKLRSAFLKRALEALEIHSITASLGIAHKRVFRHTTTIVFDHQAKRIIYRRLNKHEIARLRVGANSRGQREHHARRMHRPLSLRAPTVVALEPTLHRRVVGIGRHGVAEYAMSHARLQRFNSLGHNAEVHIGHP